MTPFVLGFELQSLLSSTKKGQHEKAFRVRYNV